MSLVGGLQTIGQFSMHALSRQANHSAGDLVVSYGNPLIVTHPGASVANRRGDQRSDSRVSPWIFRLSRTSSQDGKPNDRATSAVAAFVAAQDRNHFSTSQSASSGGCMQWQRVDRFP